MGQIKRKHTFSIIDVDEEEIVSRYCHHCMEYGFYNKLGPKILIGDERPAPDHDKWCQCIACGHIYAIHETTKEEMIKDSIETIQNPFDEGKHIIGLGNRRHKKNKYEKLLEDIEQEKDPEIRAELRKGNKVTIIE
jgi:hypothetical protein